MKPSIIDKIDAVTKIGETRVKMGGIQLPPKSVKIELTNRCNLVCKFCAVRTRGTKGVDEMDLGVFKVLTKEMRISGVEEIGLFYLGESFMAPQLLIEACKYVKQELRFPWVFLTSNAVMAKPEHVMELMKAGLDSLKWSANCYDEHQYKAITGGSKELFLQSLQNIRRAWKVRENMHKEGLTVNTLLSASSILYDSHQEEAMLDFIDEHIEPYVDKHYWLPIYSMGMHQERIQKEMGYIPTIGNMGRIDEDSKLPNRSPLPCWAAFTEGHVRVDGGLSACCFGSDAKFDMGILDGTNFMQAWNSGTFQVLREAQIRTIEEGPGALTNTCCKVCVAYEETESEKT
jgi:pyruvate-formate lyase-activating enzyme